MNGFARVRASREMEASGANPDAYRNSSGTSSNSRRYGMLSASNIIQAPISTLLEYSGLLRTRSSHQESESLINSAVSAHLNNHNRLDDSTVNNMNNGEVAIRIIGAGDHEHEREGSGGMVVGQVRELSGQSDVASVALAADNQGGDGRSDRGLAAGEGVSQSSNGNADTEAGDGAAVNGRDSSYQRYDIQQAARWIEQVLPFSLLLLVVFIRQHLQGILFNSRSQLFVFVIDAFMLPQLTSEYWLPPYQKCFFSFDGHWVGPFQVFSLSSF